MVGDFGDRLNGKNSMMKPIRAYIVFKVEEERIDVRTGQEKLTIFIERYDL